MYTWGRVKKMYEVQQGEGYENTICAYMRNCIHNIRAVNGSCDVKCRVIGS
jgi:hypothetical protein